MIAVSLQMFLPALREEWIEVGARMQARMDIAIDDAEPAVRSGFLFEDGAVDDVTHAILLRIRFMRLAGAAERFQADCRHTCAKRCWLADAAGSHRRRRSAGVECRTSTGTSASYHRYR